MMDNHFIEFWLWYIILTIKSCSMEFVGEIDNDQSGTIG